MSQGQANPIVSHDCVRARQCTRKAGGLCSIVPANSRPFRHRALCRYRRNTARPPDDKIELKDFFKITTDLPESPFGLIGGCSFQFATFCPIDEGPMVVQMNTMPPPPENNAFRFRLDWHKISTAVETLDKARICERLDRSHDYLTECFLATFTDRTIELFDPIKED